ncbi:GNAT family N-acetyltransferase [Rummeliibacillus stabekisii]|uniref:Alanine acetyltransferase n=1 Tax=Rummeliibacillus stabekisii TaxID=241244 RepID=A0A143HH27_9BACL|nr:GNAT family protein [Rummeliibacillus stabekisii]AMX01039.1 alanine acetyltransferase [Rummeliibacillus stabekisii]
MKGFPLIETDGLILREVKQDDANDLLKYLSDKEVMKYVGLEPFNSIDDALDEISWYKSIFEKGTGMRWGISLKGQDKIIGSCGFLNRATQHYRAEIGYELSKEYWGKGIASEAIEAVISYGFKELNLHRIEALIEPLNLPSQKVLERKGFIREGLLRGYEYTCGKFDDIYMFSLLKQDFIRKKDR